MSKSFSRFHQTVIEFLETVSSCVDELHDSKMTKLTSKNVDIVRGLLSKFPQADLLNVFIDSHASWRHIHERNNSFIITDVPIIYEKIGGEIISVIVLPFESYLKCLKEGKECPIGSDDIDILWQYFESMVGVACNHIFNNKCEAYDGIDVEAYSQMFCFPLKKDE